MIPPDGVIIEGVLYKYKQNLIRGFSWKKQFFRLDFEANMLYQYSRETRPIEGEEAKTRLVIHEIFPFNRIVNYSTLAHARS